MTLALFDIEVPDLDTQLARLLVSGGDERLRLDPATRRNRYGVPAQTTADEIWMSSSTAQAISPRGWDAARAALEALRSGETSPEALQEIVRGEISRIYGAPGCEVILTGSGTEAELIVLGLAMSLRQRPVTNIVAAPQETGRGVMPAADGRHFLSQTAYGHQVTQGDRLTGWEEAEIRIEALEIRDPSGGLRDPAAIDAEAVKRVEAATARGDQVILHCLDASKTGQRAINLRCAGIVAARFGDQVLAVMDACQLRCSPLRLRGQLRNGLAAMITGSKFAGGPPFCGAVLLPRELCLKLSGRLGATAALAPYSSAGDWPAGLQPPLLPGKPANLGLVLRWIAALAEINAFSLMDAKVSTAFRAEFEQAVQVAINAWPWLSRLPGAEPGEYGNLIAVADAAHADLRELWQGLADPASGPACHVGQPITVGDRDVMRLCSSMPMITDFAERVAAGAESATAFAPVAADLCRVFDKWDALRNRHES